MTRRHRVLFLRSARSRGVPVVPEEDWLWVLAGSPTEARQRLSGQEFSAVVVEMPCSEDCVETLRGAVGSAPIVLLVGEGDLVAAAGLVEQGASAVVPWDREGGCWRLLRAMMERSMAQRRNSRRWSLDVATVGASADPSLLLRRQQLDCLRSLAEGITHSLNNVFAPILMTTDLLRPKLPSAGDREMLVAVEQSVRRGTELVRQVLGFSRAVDGQRARLEIRHLIRTLSQVVKEAASGDVSVTTAYPEDLWLVVADVAQIFQALVGLCLRGREELVDGGTIRIDACNLDVTPGDAGVAGREPGSYVCLTVAALRHDAQLPAVDDAPGHTQDDKREGLALAAAAAIAEAHGGWLVASRWAGQGTVVRFGLPAVSSSRTAEETEEAEEVETGALSVEASVAAAADGIVLIADDDHASRLAMERVLTAAGFSVEGVGLTGLGQRLRGKQGVSAVVLDVGDSPLRARRLLDELARENPTVRVITTDARPEESRDEGDFPTVYRKLDKPFSSARLLRTVASALA